ncbi:MAG: SDR family oxidoreductase [Planctomyces sp.]|nr:SDR family oxidoreductase [Planctomyces sp.]
MDLGLAEDVAAIVGGAAGIGLAIAREFAAEGARVALVDRSPETPAVAETLSALGVIADVADSASLQAAADAVVARYGRCDHLIYAAGIGSRRFGFPFWNIPSDDWARLLDVNLTGAVRAAEAFRGAVAQSPQGTLLFLSSIAGQIGSQTDPPYSAAKAGLINFAQCAAKDFAPLGVRVNTICPGMIQTALNRSVYEAWAECQPEDQRRTYETWAEEKIRRLIPLGRWQQPEDIAAMAVFLASRRAKNITGQTINVDGGFVMHW